MAALDGQFLRGDEYRLDGPVPFQGQASLFLLAYGEPCKEGQSRYCSSLVFYRFYK